VLAADGNIRSGQTAFDTGTGFWLGHDGSAPKFSIGNSSGNKLTWDGHELTVIGSIFRQLEVSTITIGTPGGSVYGYNAISGYGSASPTMFDDVSDIRRTIIYCLWVSSASGQLQVSFGPGVANNNGVFRAVRINDVTLHRKDAVYTANNADGVSVWTWSLDTSGWATAGTTELLILG